MFFRLKYESLLALLEQRKEAKANAEAWQYNAAAALVTATNAVELAVQKTAVAEHMHLDNLKLRRALGILLDHTPHVHDDCNPQNCHIEYAKAVLRGPVRH